MALRFWEDLVRDVYYNSPSSQNYRQLLEQTQFHRADLDRSWTEAAIKQGFNDVGIAIPSQANVDRLVNAYHDSINKERLTSTGAFGPGTKPAPAPVGAKKASPGKLIERSDNHIICTTGTYLNTILGRALKAIRVELGRQNSALKNDEKLGITNPLQFAHGEGTDGLKTTVGGMQMVSTLSEKLTKGGQTGPGTVQDLTNYFNKDGADVTKVGTTVGILQTTLKEFVETDMKIDVDLESKQIGDRIKFKDDIIISGAAKLQQQNFPFDKPAPTEQFKTQINKKLIDAMQQGLSKRLVDLIGTKEYSSSPTSTKRMKAAVVRQARIALQKGVGKTAKVTGKKKEENFKKKASKKVKLDKGKRRVKRKKFTKASAGPVVAATQRTAASPLAIVNLINEKLSDVIKSKMFQPKLVNRTGRFAESAKVVGVTAGPRGGNIVFNYTYDKFPYQTFEPGFAQGSIQRDPRSIIGRSVRQIATQILGKRFIVARRI